MGINDGQLSENSKLSYLCNICDPTKKSFTDTQECKALFNDSCTFFDEEHGIKAELVYDPYQLSQISHVIRLLLDINCVHIKSKEMTFVV